MTCDAGPCCDGAGGFRSSAFECETPVATRCAASCGGAWQRRTSHRFCSGHGNECDGALVDDEWTTVLQCAPGWLCDADSGNCSFCDGGCDASGCLPCDWTWSAVSTADTVPDPTAWHAAAWVPTRMRMVVAGGDPAHDAPLFLYDPVADKWASAAGCDVAGRAAAVWTGSEVLVWSGPLLRYTPESGTCVQVAADPEGPSTAAHATAVWTGQRLIAWGGGDAGTSQGAVFDPAAGAWTLTSREPGCPTARRDHVAVWTGDRMVVWGGEDEGGATATGALYDPETDTWTPTSDGPGRPAPRSGAVAVWTGSRMLVWGGTGPDGALGDGAAYDLATDTWEAIPAAGAPTARYGHSMVWTGREAVVFGGGYFQDAEWVELSNGGRYDPATGTWTPIPADGAPSPRAWHSAVWTGKGMVVWGGQIVEGIAPGLESFLADGGRYRCTPK
jgi:hypothetical protein